MNVFGQDPVYRLFIGGPVDGNVLQIPARQDVWQTPTNIDLPMAELPPGHIPPQITTCTYMSCVLRSESETVTVMISEELARKGGVLTQLVTNYKRIQVEMGIK